MIDYTKLDSPLEIYMAGLVQVITKHIASGLELGEALSQDDSVTERTRLAASRSLDAAQMIVHELKVIQLAAIAAEARAIAKESSK